MISQNFTRKIETFSFFFSFYSSISKPDNSIADDYSLVSSRLSFLFLNSLSVKIISGIKTAAVFNNSVLNKRCPQ